MVLLLTAVAGLAREDIWLLVLAALTNFPGEPRAISICLPKATEDGSAMLPAADAWMSAGTPVAENALPTPNLSPFTIVVENVEPFLMLPGFRAIFTLIYGSAPLESLLTGTLNAPRSTWEL